MRRGITTALVASAVLAVSAAPVAAEQWVKTTKWVVDSVDYSAVAQAGATPDVSACSAFDKQGVANVGTYTVEGRLRSDRSVDQRAVFFQKDGLPHTNFLGLKLHLQLDRTATEHQHVFTPASAPEPPPSDEDAAPPADPPPSCTEATPDCTATHALPRKVVTMFVYPILHKPRLGIWLKASGLELEPLDLQCGVVQALAPRYDNTRHRLAVSGWPGSSTGLETRWSLPKSIAKKGRVTLRLHRQGSYSYQRKEFGRVRAISGTARLDATIRIRLVHGRCRVTPNGCISA